MFLTRGFVFRAMNRRAIGRPSGSPALAEICGDSATMTDIVAIWPPRCPRTRVSRNSMLHGCFGWAPSVMNCFVSLAGGPEMNNAALAKRERSAPQRLPGEQSG